jgi:hypothetical protein
MSIMASGRQAGGEATLPVLDIFEASAKLVLNPMNEKIDNFDSTVLRKLSN